MKSSVFTIGYEGAELPTFLATLASTGIQHLIDVRDVPISRKRGFSKSGLAVALADIGIGYTHLKALGDPKPGRDAMRRGDYSAFLTIYSSHIANDEAKLALGLAAKIARTQKIVLLCYERSPKQCHRTIVAEKLSALGTFEVRHLGVNDPAQRSREATCASNIAAPGPIPA